MKTTLTTLCLTALVVVVLVATASAGFAPGRVQSRKIDQRPQTMTVESMTGETNIGMPGQGSDRAYLTGPRQGGEDLATATVIPDMPGGGSYSDGGTTVGYADDYQESCTHNSNQPDVVYSYTPSVGQLVSISLCNSPEQWTSQLYVYENNTSTLIDCNEYGYCPAPSGMPALPSVPLNAGSTYYIVIDGVFGGQGQYLLEIETLVPIVPISTHPAFADAGNGNLVLAFEYLDVDDTALYWQGSADDGESFSTAVYWTTGLRSHASVDYWGDDAVFCGTQITSGSGNVNLVTILNPADPYSYSGVSWNWDASGWHDMKMCDIACDNGQEEWAFGLISQVNSTTYTTPAITDGPFITYRTSAESGTVSWYNDLDGCNSTSCDIDKVTQRTYAAWDWLDPADGSWKLFVRMDLFHNWDDEDTSGGYVYTVGDPGEHVMYPAVAAFDSNIVILTEYVSNADLDNHDIICWYAHDAGIGSLASAVVIDTEGDERFPEVAHVSGGTFTATFWRADSLFSTTSTDSGMTWSGPEYIAGGPGDVRQDEFIVDEYRFQDLTEGAFKVIWEYQLYDNPDSSIYLHWASLLDTDQDGVMDFHDNCPAIFNPNQEDEDVDGVGDSCDNCLATINPDQEDTDGDLTGDACDPDDDNDGVDDATDTDDTDPTICQDVDGDGCDDCSVGTDGFGPLADNDPSNDGTDTDADGQCDTGDTDDDNDGVPDEGDTDPLNPNVCADADADGCDDCVIGTDGFGPLADNLPANDGTDTDSDGLCDSGDPCPSDADNDIDGDEICGDVDNCPDLANPGQVDTDGDGWGDACDPMCCAIRGDVDHSSVLPIDIADLVYIVDYMFNGGPIPVCWGEGDIDGSGIEPIDIADLVYQVDYMFNGGPQPPACPY